MAARVRAASYVVRKSRIRGQAGYHGVLQIAVRGLQHSLDLPFSDATTPEPSLCQQVLQAHAHPYQEDLGPSRISAKKGLRCRLVPDIGAGPVTLWPRGPGENEGDHSSATRPRRNSSTLDVKLVWGDLLARPGNPLEHFLGLVPYVSAARTFEIDTMHRVGPIRPIFPCFPRRDSEDRCDASAGDRVPHLTCKLAACLHPVRRESVAAWAPESSDELAKYHFGLPRRCGASVGNLPVQCVHRFSVSGHNASVSSTSAL